MNNEVTKKVLTSGKPAPNTCNTKLVISCKSKLLGRLELWNGWRWKTTATLADGFPWPQYDCPAMEQCTEEAYLPTANVRLAPSSSPSKTQFS